MKQIALALAIVAVLPLYAGMRVCTRVFGGERAFGSVGNFLSLVPGVAGDFLRKAYYGLSLDNFSSSAGVGFGSYFSHHASRMSRDSSCGAYCILGTCDIGEGVLLGSNIHILSGKGQHSYDREGRLVKGRYERITIGDHTWIGNGAIVMAPVGRGCIVGAGAVVIDEVEDNCIVGGNPARVIRKREF